MNAEEPVRCYIHPAFVHPYITNVHILNTAASARFERDHDGTLDAKELGSKAAQSLKRLMD